MGGLRGLGKGLAKGLVRLGTDIQSAKEQEKKDKLLAEEKAFRERKFQAERKDAATRNELLRAQTMMKKAEYHTKALSSAFAMSNGNPSVMAETLSRHSNDNLVYTYNQPASLKASKNIDPKTGKPYGNSVVYDIGTYIEKPDGTLEKDPMTGKNRIDPLPGITGRTTWNNTDDWTNSMIRKMDPAEALARENSKRTIAETRERAELAHQNELKKIAAQEKSKITVAEETGVTAKNIAESKRLAKGAASTQSTIQFEGFAGPDGKPEIHKFTTDGARKHRDNMASFVKEYGGISPGEAFKISLVKDDAQDRQDFQDALADVLDPEKPEDTEKKFIEEMSEAGLPMQFIRDALEDAKAHKEEFPDVGESGKKAQGYWDRVWGTFSGS